MAERDLFADGDFGASVWELPLAEAAYFVIDIETSGFSAVSDVILSLAAGCMRGSNPKLDPTLYELVRPEDVRRIPERVWALTGLTPEAVNDGAPLDDVLYRALAMSVHRVWVAHHARHELSFLQRHTRRIWKMPLRPIVIDTSVVARALWRLPSVPTLESVCCALDIPVANRHRADADIAMTAEVWAREQVLCEQLGLKTVSEVVEWAAAHAFG
jgi:DNA polymerase-3 subunit epsilon